MSTTATTRLRAIMAEQGWSLRRLAGVLDVSYETVRRWQLGEHAPYPRAGQRLEAVLRVPLEDLMQPENENGADRKASAVDNLATAK